MATVVDEQTQAFLDKAQASPAPPPGSQPIEEFRAAMDAFKPLGFDPPELHEVRDETLRPEHPSEVRVRIYDPGGDGARPVLVWAHGGSWVRCNLETHDPMLRVVAKRSGCIVVSVDYRLAPEHVFPAALDDVYGAVRWVSDHASEIGGDPDRIAVGGDSSGGNLAAAVAILARMHGDFELSRQVLLLPVLDATFKSESWRELGQGYLLTREQLEWAIGQYAPGVGRRDSLLSPLHAERFDDLSPALIVTGECDPLRDEGEAFASRLSAAGVEVEHRRVPGLIHHAMLVPKVIDLGARVVEETADAIGTALGPDGR
jgi:acetyl esterase